MKDYQKLHSNYYQAVPLNHQSLLLIHLLLHLQLGQLPFLIILLRCFFHFHLLRLYILTENNEAANKEVFADGWFRTGDIGFLDEYGALHINGRKKNLIILSNGENISAEEIESYVYSIPYVGEVIASGKNDVISIEVFLDEDVDKNSFERDIAELNKTLPLTKNIGNISYRDTEFPKTTTKKIIRNYIEV